MEKGAKRRDGPVSRRKFIVVGATAVGGLLIGVRIISRLDPDEPAGEPFAPNAFIRIEPDETIVIVVPRPEMGQGVRTSLAMLVAEELDADWARVRVASADLDEERYGPQFAGGSAVVRTSWMPLREAGAAARLMLVTAAATRWSVPVAECVTENSTVHHRQSHRQSAYAELLVTARTVAVPTSVVLKDPAQYRLIGTPVRGVDSLDIVTGRATFGIDVRVPGMLFASVERSPVFGGRVQRFDGTASSASAGVVSVVPIDADAVPEFEPNSPKMANGVAVIATSTWKAMAARRLLRVEWDARGAETESTARMRAEAVQLSQAAPRNVSRHEGNVTTALASSHRQLNAVYETPLVAHSPMEPMNCTADVRADRCEIWAPTQDASGARAVAARVTGLAPEAITVHLVRMGGSFGRRFYSDFVGEAVYLSKAAGRPVQVVWTREDDIRHDLYRPAGYYVMKAGLTADGSLTAWSQHLINASRGHYLRWVPSDGETIGPGELEPFDVPAGLIPNVRFAYSPLTSRIPRGQWRAVEPSSSVFVSQCFLDEVAHAAGRDPLEYQLALLAPSREVPFYGRTYSTGRLAAVLRLAAERSGWGTQLATGRGRGIAASFSNSLYAAHVAEVEVTDGRVRVHRVVSAIDGGIIINPLGARAQVEGSVIYGLSAALRGEITVEGGRVVQSNFTDYPPLRINEAPVHEVHFVASNERPSGLGEGALPGVAPAVANALFAATGDRRRRLPLEGTS